jgi:hypothetical protein
MENIMNTVFDFTPLTKPSAEMYYNYNKSSSCSSSDSTFQQSTEPKAPTDVNVQAPAALISSSGASHPRVRKNSEGTGNTGEPRKNIPRKVSLDDYYVQINMSVNEIRRGTRTDRLNCYISIREENDKKFSIYLRSSLTTATDETRRSLRKTDNRVLEEALIEMQMNCPDDAKFFSGRLRYNPRRFKIEDDHKTNLKSALLGIYDHGTHMTAVLFLLGEYYPVALSDDLTEKQKGTFNFTGNFTRDVEEEE